ncbi:ABC transporter permease [Polymorphobacter fuscus]|uniref:Transport permease protein n=1 Tax=Sandarakinorhabdus fusca TaxID=1439888 RepID=A0A7C9KVI2_9SPHN|nr:ABC transporter permease [Polymorphobacter fuscus]KAB7648424.1 multidrug ABC transporter permease [Polymorphobacter fuscus]MQT15942.1 multidrug ABC transporter permease [Polymorphobacter fuscus]NJC07782.1 ABC-2 type transport system permease protein [Polymorphobacter fuscus]
MVAIETPRPVDSQARHPEPGVVVIPSVNWQGLQTLYLKEVRRFFKVQLQTVWAPAITTLLFLVIFALALGQARPAVLGVPFPDFLGPGLIVMGMIQNSFANSSSSLLVAKVQGSIIDVLMPPLSAGELVAAYVAGALTRAWLVGLAVWVVMAIAPGVNVPIRSPLLILYFGTMGAVMLALLGILTGIWADKFDHAAAVTNFVIQPLTLLSGTFYAIDRVNPTMATISHANPFFYIIDGFRSGFIGISDGLLGQGAVVLLVLNIVLWWVCYRVMRSGWRLKA